MYRNYAIYDLEIKNIIPNKSYRDSSLQYCNGWNDFEGMGISCGGVSYSDNHEIYTDPLLLYKRLIELQNKGVYVGGFNNFRFDDKLLSATVNNFESDFDLLRIIKDRVGHFTPRV